MKILNWYRKQEEYMQYTVRVVLVSIGTTLFFMTITKLTGLW